MNIQTTPGSTNHLEIDKPNTKKDFVLLANHLRAYATQFPEYSAEHCEKVTFNASGYKVKCQPNSEAIRRLADKISKGIPRLKTWVEPKLPCVKPYTAAQKINLAAKYRKEAHNLKHGNGSTKQYYSGLNIKQQIAKSFELQDFAEQLEASIPESVEAVAA